MLSRIYKLLLILIIFEAIMAQLNFPEHIETDKKKSNLAGRLPLYAPTRCRHDEWLYPGDQKNDWICDCAPAALYHPESDSCYPAFRQGPCPAEQFLILRPDAIIPQCIPNTCKIDGQVKIQNVCYEFGKGKPCRDAHLSYVLGVDPVTLKVDCVKLSITLQTRFGEDTTTPATASTTPTPNYDYENIDLCARGSKRAQNGQCPEK